jgi:hypothetical protein
MAQDRRPPAPKARPKPTDPIRLDVDPTGEQVVSLWRATDKRFPESRKRIRDARDVLNKDPRTVSDRDDRPLTLPQRLMAVTMTNSLASQYGTPELTRHGRPVATDKSDEIETVLKATLEKLISVADIFGLATQASEWGAAVLPGPADWAHVPVYSEAGYDFDAEGAKKGARGYTQRDGAKSRRAFDKDYEDWLAKQQYVVIDLIDPTDCAPILARGTRGRRFEARGLLVRRLFAREDLLGMGYRCEALKEQHATLIPRGDKANVRGKGGQLWLYTYYVTLWDEKTEELVPCIIYSVAGEDTYRGAHTDGERQGEPKPAVINLRDEWGISTPLWGYYHGLHTADPDPDRVGLPFGDAYNSLVLTLERMIAASVHHAERSSFRGSWVEPGEQVPPEAYTETVENQLRLKRFDPPESGELVTAPGRVTPDAPPPLGPAATQMMAAMMQQLEMNRPDPAQPAGRGASGHAMSLASGLIEAAHADIPRGVLECYQDLASGVLECLCGIMRTKEVPYVLDANEELSPDQPGDRRSVAQRYTLTESDIGDSYKITATWRQKPDLANITVTMDRAVKGYASIVDVLEASGETNTTYKVAEILFYKQVMIPGTPENLELSAYVARKRGEADKAQMLELQAKQLVAPQGTPTAAIAPDAQQIAGQAAQGGQGGPSGVATGVKSSIAASVQGAVGAGPTNADALAGTGMGVRPAMPSPNGGVPAVAP